MIASGIFGTRARNASVLRMEEPSVSYSFPLLSTRASRISVSVVTPFAMLSIRALRAFSDLSNAAFCSVMALCASVTFFVKLAVVSSRLVSTCCFVEALSSMTARAVASLCDLILSAVFVLSSLMAVSVASLSCLIAASVASLSALIAASVASLSALIAASDSVTC